MVFEIVTKCLFSFREKHLFAKRCHTQSRGEMVVFNLTRQLNDKVAIYWFK